MRFLFFAFVLLQTVRLNAQAQGSLVSMNGIGDLKIGMKKADVEKLTGQKVRLTNLLKSDEEYGRDSIQIVHKNTTYMLVFDKDYRENSKDFIVFEISSHSPGLKTRSGITMGDDKLKIVSTYDDYTLHIHPEYEGTDFLIKSKTRSTVMLFGDTSETVILFHLTNNKVTGFTVMFNEGC